MNHFFTNWIDASPLQQLLQMFNRPKVLWPIVIVFMILCVIILFSVNHIPRRLFRIGLPLTIIVLLISGTPLVYSLLHHLSAGPNIMLSTPPFSDESSFVRNLQTEPNMTDLVNTERTFTNKIMVSPNDVLVPKAKGAYCLEYDPAKKAFKPLNTDGEIIKAMMDKAYQILKAENIKPDKASAYTAKWSNGADGYLLKLELPSGKDYKLFGPYNNQNNPITKSNTSTDIEMVVTH